MYFRHFCNDMGTGVEGGVKLHVVHHKNWMAQLYLSSRMVVVMIIVEEALGNLFDLSNNIGESENLD